MADAHKKPKGSEGGDGGPGAGFLILFFGGIFLLWMLTGAGEGPGLFDMASSTSASSSEATEASVKKERMYRAPAQE